MVSNTLICKNLALYVVLNEPIDSRSCYNVVDKLCQFLSKCGFRSPFKLRKYS